MIDSVFFEETLCYNFSHKLSCHNYVHSCLTYFVFFYSLYNVKYKEETKNEKDNFNWRKIN